jgi:hypothetical protein
MTGSIYLLNRKVNGDQGETFNQSVAVYAQSAKEAKDLVHQEFERIRKVSDNPEHPYHDLPPFEVDEIHLDEHKLLIHWVTS